VSGVTNDLRCRHCQSRWASDPKQLRTFILTEPQADIAGNPMPSKLHYASTLCPVCVSLIMGLFQPYVPAR
jgi:hypothetical protein